MIEVHLDFAFENARFAGGANAAAAGKGQIDTRIEGAVQDILAGAGELELRGSTTGLHRHPADLITIAPGPRLMAGNHPPGVSRRGKKQLEMDPRLANAQPAQAKRDLGDHGFRAAKKELVANGDVQKPSVQRPGDCRCVY